jgi:hypothetical protein
MATLQAARAFVLGLPLDVSLSWGLNRAIFYAAAKRGFKKPTRERPRASIMERPILEEKDVYFLGDEMAYKAEEQGKTCFIIGDKPQAVEDFKRQIESRFGVRFEEAWKEALELVRSFDEGVLLSQRGFYEQVYRPRRDAFAKKWTELSRGEP